MKIQFASDLHLECGRDRGKSLVASIQPVGDVLVLAGDIMQFSHFKHEERVKLFGSFTTRWPRVFYVPGNHEYYKSDPDTFAKALQKLQGELPVLEVLEAGRVLEVGSRRFLGGTMWFPEAQDLPWTLDAKKAMNDFDLIKGLEPWCYNQNAQLRRFLQRELREGDVVVTHHLPSARSTPAEYRSSTLNPFFVSDQTDLIAELEPALWIHGHTHTRCDYQLLKTRVVCNPHGYPYERSPRWFREDAVIEVD
jgi:Icc-related predicted phosphoesterase